MTTERRSGLTGQRRRLSLWMPHRSLLAFALLPRRSLHRAWLHRKRPLQSPLPRRHQHPHPKRHQHPHPKRHQHPHPKRRHQPPQERKRTLRTHTSRRRRRAAMSPFRWTWSRAKTSPSSVRLFPPSHRRQQAEARRGGQQRGRAHPLQARQARAADSQQADCQPAVEPVLQRHAL